MKHKKKLYTITVPPVSNEFAKILDSAFPPIVIEPGMDEQKLFMNAGERRVVEWVKQHSSGSVILGNITDTKPSKMNKSLLNNILGIIKRN